MAAVSSMILAGTAIMSANQARLQADAQKQMGEAKASMFENNARVARLQAEDAMIRGEKEAAKAGVQGKQVLGSQRVALAAQGIDITQGSAADIQSETLKVSAENQTQIRNNAWREAWGYKVQASDYSTQGKYAMLGANNEANNTLLTGKLQAANQLAQAYQYSNYANSTRTPSSTKSAPRTANVTGGSYLDTRGYS